MGRSLERFGEVEIVYETDGFGMEFFVKTDSKISSATPRCKSSTLKKYFNNAHTPPIGKKKKNRSLAWEFNVRKESGAFAGIKRFDFNFIEEEFIRLYGLEMTVYWVDV